MGEYAEELLLQRIFGDAVVVKQSRLGPPADVEGGVDVGGGPVHDPAQLRPVVHVGEVVVLHRGAGDNHAVVLPVLDLVKGGVEGGQVVRVSVLGDVAGHLKQLHLDLERRVGQLAQQLGLSDDFGGHQIEDEQVQRAHVLVDGPVLGHNEDIFSLQRSSGG